MEQRKIRKTNAHLPNCDRFASLEKRRTCGTPVQHGGIITDAGAKSATLVINCVVRNMEKTFLFSSLLRNIKPTGKLKAGKLISDAVQVLIRRACTVATRAPWLRSRQH